MRTDVAVAEIVVIAVLAAVAEIVAAVAIVVVAAAVVVVAAVVAAAKIVAFGALGAVSKRHWSGAAVVVVADQCPLREHGPMHPVFLLGQACATPRAASSSPRFCLYHFFHCH